jgi:hypothetical protein
MKASELFTSEHYAWKSNPPKGRIPIDAKKVRLRHTEQRKRDYMQNKSTFAAITEVETGRERTVPARELIMFWDEYEGERDHLLAERREHEMRIRRDQLRRTVVESMMNYRLHEKGIPITISYYSGGTATIASATALKDWLGISEEEITEAIDNQMDVEYGEEEN